jgi:hypothetical protein
LLGVSKKLDSYAILVASVVASFGASEGRSSFSVNHSFQSTWIPDTGFGRYIVTGTQPLISAYGQNGFNEFCIIFVDEMVHASNFCEMLSGANDCRGNRAVFSGSLTRLARRTSPVKMVDKAMTNSSRTLHSNSPFMRPLSPNIISLESTTVRGLRHDVIHLVEKDSGLLASSHGVRNFSYVKKD